MTATTSDSPVGAADRARRAFSEPKSSFAGTSRASRRLLGRATVSLFALMVLGLFLSPLAYMATTSVKTSEQISDATQPLLPESPEIIRVDGIDRPVLKVPLPSGARTLILLKKGRESSVFIDADHPDEQISWQGNWRTLKPAYHLAPSWSNYRAAYKALKVTLLLRNTFAIAILGMIGTVISSVIVAYGLSRFRVPFAKTIMASLVAAIILPRFLLITPLYAAYQRLGLVGTWVPLIAPHFFANAYNVFLLRQFFLTIPAEMDEAAALDGAGPLKTLWSVIIPQARPAILVVALFHFYFAWNDFLEPLVYLSNKASLQPISVGLFGFLGLYSVQLGLLQAAAVLGMAIPVIVFIIFQRAFLKGIDLSGATK
jgi:multiple sugar transport system permease protein